MFGLGGLGFNALQIVHNIGARIIVCDIKQERLDEAAKLGIPTTDIVPIGKLPQEFVLENNLKIDTVLDFVGTHQTFEDAQHIGQYQTHPSLKTVEISFPNLVANMISNISSSRWQVVMYWKS